MAPYSSTDQENIINYKVNYGNGGDIKHPYMIKYGIYESNDQKKNLIKGKQLSFKSKYTNEDYSVTNYPSNMATYAQYVPQQYFPITINDWNPIITLPIYTSVHQVPFVPINSQTINPTVIPLCPCGTVITENMIPVVTPTVITEAVPIPENYYEPLANYVPEDIPSPINDALTNEDVADSKLTPTESVNSDGTEDSIESYLRLPKELFPTPRMFTIDPNQIIDVFCDEDITDHTPWLLDLEFGLPRVAVTRHIPIYDVQFNSIHCKNTPSAIHPGFERCSKGFKRELLFYYDCIVSTWYKGFVAIKNDTSVKNFQTWLLKAMQVFGMCWP